MHARGGREGRELFTRIRTKNSLKSNSACIELIYLPTIRDKKVTPYKIQLRLA